MTAFNLLELLNPPKPPRSAQIPSPAKSQPRSPAARVRPASGRMNRIRYQRPLAQPGQGQTTGKNKQASRHLWCNRRTHSATISRRQSGRPLVLAQYSPTSVQPLATCSFAAPQLAEATPSRARPTANKAQLPRSRPCAGLSVVHCSSRSRFPSGIGLIVRGASCTRPQSQAGSSRIGQKQDLPQGHRILQLPHPPGHLLSVSAGSSPGCFLQPENGFGGVANRRDPAQAKDLAKMLRHTTPSQNLWPILEPLIAGGAVPYDQH